MTRARLQGCFCDPARAHLRCGREGVYCIICHQDSNSSSEISLFLSLSSTLMAESMSDSVGGGIPSCRTPGPSSDQLWHGRPLCNYHIPRSMCRGKRRRTPLDPYVHRCAVKKHVIRE